MSRHLRLTHAQSAMWAAQEGFADKSICNLSGYNEIGHDIDLDRFRVAADMACAEAEAFHLRFVDTQDGPRQYVDRDLPSPLSFYDLTSESDPNRSANVIMQADATRCCDPSRDPLYSVALLRISSTSLYFYLRCHQLIADSFSLKLFFQNVADLYSNPSEHTSQKRTPGMSWEELLAAEERFSKEPEYQIGHSYWKSCLASKPESVTLSGKLPTAAGCRHSIAVSRPLSKSLATRLRGFAESNGITLKELLLSYVAHYLYKYTGETDILVGIPVNDRPAGGGPRQIGPRSHVTPLRISVEPHQTFAGLMEHTTKRLAEATLHQRVPPEGSGLYGTLVHVSTDDTHAETRGMWIRRHDLAVGPICDLSISITNLQTSEDLQLDLRANSANYTQRSLELHARRVLDLLSNDSNLLLTRSLSRVSLLSATERATVVSEWNSRSKAYANDRCIHELFETQAALRPESIAVAFQNRTLTYSELNMQANQLARYLRRFGVGPGKAVAICVDRGTDMILGLLAILKAGGAYVPLDPGFPSDRLEYMLKDSAPAALIGHAATDERLAGLANDTPRINLSDESVPWSSCSGENLDTGETGVAPSNLVYVIYTSGSTGQPKGVGIRGTNLLNYSSFILEQIPPAAALKFASVSTIAADLGNTVVFPSLIGGGELHIVGLDTATNAKLYEEYMREHEIDVLKITPSHFKALFEARKSKVVVPRRALIFGGERLTSDLVDSIAELRPECAIYNHYGPTECTVGSIMSLIEKDREYNVSIPLGYPIANSRIYVLDSDDEPVPIGVVGEIHIAGAGVALGYINREEETRKRFKRDPFSQDPTERMYMTGDLGRWLPSGMIEFLGRNDFQVKIRGFRIELGEIESALSQYSGIHETAVIAREGTAGKRLVAYYTSDSDVSAASLRSHLLVTLPDYMVPALFMRLDAMPLTPNGKLDRRALPEPGHESNVREVVAPRNEAERALLEGWRRVLDSADLDTSQSFVGIGGDSLSYIGVSMIVEKVLGWMPKDWDRLTIRELALLKKDTRQSTSSINSTILVRAVSIILVVLDHFRVINLGGTTSALFIVSGWSFGRYQINSVHQNGNVRPIVSTIYRIALPVVLYTLFMQLTISSVRRESLLLYDNFIDPFFNRGVSYWFIEVLVQILVVMTGVMSIKRIRTYAFQNQFVFGVAGATLSLVVGGLVNHLWDTEYLYNRLPHMRLWLFFFGIAIASAVTRRQKCLLIGGVVLYYLGSTYGNMAAFGVPVYSLIAATFVILVERVKIPARLTPVINSIAGASLFIYMTHFQFARVIEKSGLTANMMLSSVVAVAGAVILSNVWDFVYHWAFNCGSRLVKYLGPKGSVSN